VICKACQEKGLKSTVQEIGAMQTLKHTPRSWDENGNERPRAKNTVTTRYSCSNGHYFEEKT
jgi:hypothetical protein